jgi:hypothetical protein
MNIRGEGGSLGRKPMKTTKSGPEVDLKIEDNKKEANSFELTPCFIW